MQPLFIILFLIIGHCSMIGAQTGKVLGYEVRSKVCRICQSAERNKKEAKDHDCRQNWQGVYCLKTISKYVK